MKNSIAYSMDLETLNIPHGDIIKVINKDHQSFKGFGELYFSDIDSQQIKGWKCNENAYQMLIVLSGSVNFVCTVDKEFSKTYEYNLTSSSLKALFIYPKTWYAFKGISDKTSRIMSLINIKHIDIIQKKIPVAEIIYDWNKK